jgi:hypothetical protein
MELHFYKFVHELNQILSLDLAIYKNEPSAEPIHAQPELSQTGYYLLIQSILEGEYYLKYNDPVLLEIPTLLSKIELRKQKLKQYVKNSKIAFQHNDFLKKSLKSISLYEELRKIGYETLHGTSKVPRIDFIKELRTLEVLQFVDPEEKKNNYLNLLRISISLAQIDLSLNCSTETVDELNGIQRYLTSNKAMMLNEKLRLQQEILLEKTEFLLNKIKLRKAKDTILDKDEIQGWKDELSKMKHYSGFMKKTISHYLYVRDNEFADYCVRGSEGGIAEIHAKNKALRKGVKLNKSVKFDVESLKAHLDKMRAEDPDNLFNDTAYNTASYMLLNTNLFLDLKKKGKIKDVADDLANIHGAQMLNDIFQDIERLHSDSNNFDYYLYSQFLEFLNNLVDYLRDNPLKLITKDWKKFDNDKDRDVEMKEVNIRISEIERLYLTALKKFNEHLDKWEYSNCSPVYLTDKECVLDNKLFLDSAYILPTDFGFIKNNWIGAKGRLKGHLRSLKNRAGIELNIELFETKYKKELDSRDMKAVTVLALFISVASFILGTVKIMEGRDVYTSQSLMLTFGTGLIMFNLIIYWLTNKNEKWHIGDIFTRNFYKLLTLRSIAILVLLLGFLFLISYRSNDYKLVADKRIDSLKKEATLLHDKIDSLKSAYEASTSEIKNLGSRLTTLRRNVVSKMDTSANPIRQD